MATPNTETPAAADAPSDAELIARVRNGDVGAFGELFSRHHRAAERLGRQLVPATDAEDLAGDAFAKVLEVLRAGGGPDVSFRAYLLTTLRRMHVDRLRASRRVQTTDDISAYERAPKEFDDPTVLGFESGAAAKAFASLPERWQAVLWHTEIEGDKPAALAPLLGLTPNGVSALAYRAREGLRQAYLQQHLADTAGDRCRWATERLGGYVRGGLPSRENRQLRAHLDGCARCAAVYLELVEVNSALPALLAPAVLGAAGAGYLAAATAEAAGLGGLTGLTGLWSRLKTEVTEHGGRSAAVSGGLVTVAVLFALLVVTDDDPGADPPAAIRPGLSESSGSATAVPSPAARTQPRTAPSTGQLTIPPGASTTGPVIASPGSSTTGTTPGSTTAPTTGPATAATTGPTTGPTTAPSRPPTTQPTTPVQDEGLLVIRPRGARSESQPGAGSPAGPYAAPEATHKRTIVINAPKDNTSPVVVRISYGSSLSWPAGGGTGNWSCSYDASARQGSCTAKHAHNQPPIQIVFTPQPGSGGRGYTVSARVGQLYDADSETLPAP